MNPLPQHANNTLDVAKQTLAISEKSGDRTLRIFGYIMLAVTGLGTLIHASHAIYRDLFSKKAQGEHGQSHRGPERTPRHNDDDEPQAASNANGQQGSWVRKARLTERQPAGDHARAAYRGSTASHGRRL